MAIEALYLHIPFCQSKCAYCDFDSVAACSLDDARAAQACYLDRLTNRVDAFGTAGLLDGVRTVYIGGGTPSLLGMRLVELVRSVMQWCAPEEFTCEANPESFTSSLALQLARAGVTRISLGVQSLQEEELKAVGRIHSATQALDAICYAKDAGLDVSCDLMCGLPLQTQDSWAKSVAGLIEAGPCHISIYPLTVEDGTPLALKVDSGRLVLPDEDEQADEMELARRFLVEAGFAPYEVASYALPGHAGTTSHIGPALSIWGLVARLLACFLAIRIGCLHRYFPILRLATAQLAFACFKRMMLLLPLRLSSLTFGRPWPRT